MSPSPNAPMETYWDRAASRLFNLVIALINSEKPRSKRWLIDHVAGYEHSDLARPAAGSAKTEKPLRSAEGALKLLQSDLARLAELDIIPHEVSTPDDELLFLGAEDLFLPEVPFSPEELHVLAALSNWSLNDELGQRSQRALAKLRAIGVNPHTATPNLGIVPDPTELRGKDIDQILLGLEKGLRIGFWYYPSQYDEGAWRTIEPWAYGAREARLYVTGWDVDRRQQRTFRLSRISDVTVEASFAKYPRPESTPAELIDRGLQASGQVVDAVLRFTSDDGAWELRSRVDEHGRINSVDRSWLISAATQYAPDVLVLSPPDVQSEVIERLIIASKTPSDESSEGESDAGSRSVKE